MLSFQRHGEDTCPATSWDGIAIQASETLGELAVGETAAGPSTASAAATACLSASTVTSARKAHHAVVAGTMLGLFGSTAVLRAEPPQATITINDSAHFHVHPPGQKFTIELDAHFSIPGAWHYHWANYLGSRLTRPQPLLNDKIQTIESPSDSPGYYGLVLSSTDSRAPLPQREVGESLEFGFAIMPAPTATPASDNARFGVVYADKSDPYMPVWIKSLTWENTSYQWWDWEMQQRLLAGKRELPTINDTKWSTDDRRSVSLAELEALKQRAKQYFTANSDGPLYWETGVEENLQAKYHEPYYWQNLTAKAEAVHAAATETNPHIKLVYQVANLVPEHVAKFLHSNAARYYDVLSLHPYAWPDFKAPELWLEDYMNYVSQQTAATQWDKPIWFTEIGVPQLGNAPGAFFGYPKSATATGGLSSSQVADYLIKVAVLSAQSGVDKLFWYNYQDRGPERDYVESHFGLRDYRGYLKPSYVALANLVKQLEGKEAHGARQTTGNVRIFEFRGQDNDVIVAWTFPGRTTSISLETLRAGLTPGDFVQVLDSMGRPLPVATTESEWVVVRSHPRFFIIKSGCRCP